MKSLLLALAFAPALLLALVGQYSRLAGDDYNYLGKMRELGLWESLLFWRELWQGKFSNQFVYGALTPVGSAAPALHSWILLALGLAGLTWLAWSLLGFLGARHHVKAASVGLGALALAGAFHAFPTATAWLWYSAAVEYSLPSMLFVLCVAGAAHISSRLSGNRSLVLAAGLAAGLAFLIGGFSEMFLVFQLVFLLAFGFCALVFARGSGRRVLVILAFAAIFGSLVCLAAQLSAPGLARRGSLPDNFGLPMRPIRDPMALSGRALEETFKRVGQQPAFAGFALALSASVFTALALYKPRGRDLNPKPRALATRATAVALLAQLLFIPILWSHRSDAIQLFGRFSYGFALVALLNLALGLGLAGMLAGRGWLRGRLARGNVSMVYIASVCLTIAGLFALSQLRSIDYRAATFLVVSAISLLNLLVWQLNAMVEDSGAKSIALLAILATLIVPLAFAGISAAQLFAQGAISNRVYASVSVLTAAAGLFWGLSLGASLKRVCLARGLDGWAATLRISSLLIAVVIGGGIMASQARRIPALAEAAALWDADHQRILQLREAGDPALYTMKFTVPRAPSQLDSLEHAATEGVLGWSQLLFYGLEYEMPPYGYAPKT